jgi:hypothetical protein
MGAREADQLASRLEKNVENMRSPEGFQGFD